MNKNIFLFLILLLLGLFGCTSAPEINHIALVGVQYNRQFIRTDHHGTPKSFNLVKFVGGQLLGIGALKDADKDFFDAFTASALSLFQNKGFIVSTPSDFKENDLYSSINEDRKITNRFFHYVPEHYRYIDVIKYKEDATSLCQALNVDAVANIDFSFLKMEEPVMLGESGERLGVKVMINVINNQGTILLNETYFVKSPVVLDPNETNDALTVTTKNKVAYNQLKETFLSTLQEKLTLLR